MFPRLRTAHVTVVALACAVILGHARGDEPCKMTRQVTKVYAVADLVVPVKDCDCGPPLPRVVKDAAAPFCGRDAVAEIINCDFEVMCQQPDEQPCCKAGTCCQSASCCPNGACCPDGPCCQQAGCCQKGETNWTAVAAPEWHPHAAAQKPVTPDRYAKRLMMLVTSTVQPKCWACAGGSCTIDYYPRGMGLVVNAPPDVQELVADLLDALRKLSDDSEVAFDVKVVAVGDGPFQQMFAPEARTKFDAGRPVFLDCGELRTMMEALQGDRHTNIVQSPKLTVLNGQKAAVRCTQDQYFVTSLNTVKFEDQVVYVPVNSPYPLGFQMAVRPTVSADRKFVRCELNAEYADLASPNVPLFPTTTFITPTFEGGAQGQPVPFTQFLQQPGIVKRAVSKSLTIPDGGTAVLYAGKRIKEDDVAMADDASAPFFDWIYDFVDMFHPPTPAPTFEEHLFVLVTPRVIRTEETDSRSMAVSLPMPVGPVAQAPCPMSCPTSNSVVFTGEDWSGPPRVIRRQVPVYPSMPETPATPAPIVRQCAAMADGETCPATPCCPAAPQCAGGPCPMQQAAASQQQVQLDVCVLCMDPANWDKPITATWSDLAPVDGCGRKLLSPEEATRFCQFMKQNGAAKLLAEPRIVTQCGRPATFSSGGQQACARGLVLSNNGGTLAMHPVPQVIPFGTSVTFLADTFPDGIYLQCECELSSVTPTKQYRVTIQGPAGEEPRTETVQIAGQGSATAARIAAAVPTGRTLLFHCGKNAEGESVIVTVTPHLLGPVAAMVPPPPPVDVGMACYATPVTPPIPPPAVPCSATAAAPAYEPQLVTGQFAAPGELPPLTRMMAMYQKACAAGEKEKAQAFADCCLAIDPTCFGK
jgi:hypothetical protein